MCNIMHACETGHHGEGRAVIVCVEHAMRDFIGFVEVGSSEILCPIGRIERAADVALAKIDAATRAAQERV